MDQSLLVFVTVVEKENFTRAAESLHMTQPAVSQYIQTLERQVGTKLLERSNKYVRLNKAGEIVYYHAKQIIGHYTRMQNLVDELMYKASGSLAIGASYTFGEYILPHIIAHLQVEYSLIEPSIRISNTKEIAELLLNHHLDIGIIEGDFDHEKLHIEPFAEDEMYIVVSAHHPFGNRNQIQLSELENETWIIREQGSGTREATDKMFVEYQFQPYKKMEFGSTQVIKESVEAGLGITLLSHWAVRKEISVGTLKILKAAGRPIKRKFYVMTRRTEFHTKAMDVFIELLKEKKAIPTLNVLDLETI